MYKHIGLTLLLISHLVWGHSAQARHPEVSAQDLKKWGFKAQSRRGDLFRSTTSDVLPYAPFSLKLPVLSIFETDPFGGIMHQLQDYSTPDYYHAGLDIRTNPHDIVISPVDGWVEAGYYAYTDEPDGRSTKYFLSYADVKEGKGKPPWGELYFEVAVVDDFGYRFELHHLDAATLTPKMIDKILLRSRVAKGDPLAQVIPMPGKLQSLPYHHVHYNVVSPQGRFVNPLYISEPVNDQEPPLIHFIYSVSEKACSNGGPTLVDIKNETSKFIVVETNDYIKGRYFANPPTRLRANFRDSTWEWDFTETLADKNSGRLPDLRDYYVQDSCDFRGIPRKASNSFQFYIKVPVPSDYKGSAKIEVFDVYGNTSSQTIEIRTPSVEL